MDRILGHKPVTQLPMEVDSMVSSSSGVPETQDLGSSQCLPYSDNDRSISSAATEASRLSKVIKIKSQKSQP